MITAAVSTALVAGLRLFGVRLSAGQIGVLVLVVKGLVVLTGLFITTRVARARKAAQQRESGAAPDTAGVPSETPSSEPPART